MPEELIHIAPDEIDASSLGIRYNYKESRRNALAADILEAGGVQTPIDVEPITGAKAKPHYRLLAGGYRYRAVDWLNKDQQAGLTLPAIVRTVDGELPRLRSQLRENRERENMSPMDDAVAIKKLMEAKVSRTEICRIFSRPMGRKGLALQPASNAWLNITLRLLELPKAIQEKIHDGRVGFAAAYELGKVSPDKRQLVLDRAEADRQRQIDAEEKDEEKYLAQEEKAKAADTKKAEADKALEDTKAEVIKAHDLVDSTAKALRDVQKAEFTGLDEKAKKELAERLHAAQADAKAALKLEKDAKNAYAKLLTRAKSATDSAVEMRARLDAARKAKPAPKKGPSKGTIGPSDIKSAARAEGVNGSGAEEKPLMLAEVRAALKEVMNQKDYPKTAAIAGLFFDCFNSLLTPKETAHAVAVLVGESTVTGKPTNGKGKK